MASQKRNKIKLATELWKTMPGVSNREFVAAYKKKHGTSISMPAAHYAKSLAGLVKRRKKMAVAVPSIEDLKKAKNIAANSGGVDALLKQISVIEAIAAPVGGIESLKAMLASLKELSA